MYKFFKIWITDFMIKQKYVVFLMFLCAVFLLQEAQSCDDSRYFPWYQKPSGRTAEKRSFLYGDLFFVTAGSAYGSTGRERKSIPELVGIYDLKKLSDAVIGVGLTTQLLTQWQ